MKHLSVTEYAKLEKISRQAVLKRIKAGSVKAKKIGNNYIITIKAMKNIILILALSICFFSCRKHHEDPISKDATLHIEYSASHPTFSGSAYVSKVMIYFSNKSPIALYSPIDKNNIISTDISIQGGQHVTITGSVIDSTGSCTCHGLASTMALTFNGSSLTTTSTSGISQYSGTLDFIK